MGMGSYLVEAHLREGRSGDVRDGEHAGRNFEAQRLNGHLLPVSIKKGDV